MGTLDTPTRRYTWNMLRQAYPDLRDMMLPANLKPSTTFTQGMRLGKVTASGVLAPYNSGASDGTQKAVALCPRNYVTDASGNIFVGSVALGEFGESEQSVNVYYGGVFALSELPGITDQEIADLGGQKKDGTLLVF